MRRERYWLKAARLIFYIAVLACMIILIVQFNDIQRRLIDLEQGGARTALGPTAASTSDDRRANFGVSKNRKWLHPDEPNFIINDRPLYRVFPDANYQTIAIPRSETQERGFNKLIENSAYVSEYSSYVGCFPAWRDWDEPQKWLGELAERVELTNDGKDFTMYLKRGVKWHRPLVDLDDPQYSWLGGDHCVTAHDIKFTVDTILNPQVEAGFGRSYYQDLDSVEVVDDHTVVFRWKKKLYTNAASTLEVDILPEFIYAYDEDGRRFPKEAFGFKFNNHWYNDRMIGCGPYEFKGQVPGISVLLERNEDYFIGPRPTPKAIKYLIVKDDNLALLKLKGGEIGVMRLLPESVYRDEILGGDPDNDFHGGKLKYKIYPRTVYYYIGWNMEHPIFRDKLVRQAMTHAFDRKGVLHTVLMDLGEVLVGPVLPMFAAYNHEIEPYPFDLKRAAELLGDAGWKDVDGDGVLEKEIDGRPAEFEFTMMFTNLPIYKTMYAMYKENLRKIGVKMNINIVDWAVFQKKQDDKDFDATHGVWSMGVDTDLFQIWHSSQADIPRGSNRVSFKNGRADRIIVKLRETFDERDRTRLLREFQEIIHEEQPYTFLFSRNGVVPYQGYFEHVIPKITRPNIQFFTLSAPR